MTKHEQNVLKHWLDRLQYDLDNLRERLSADTVPSASDRRKKGK